VTRTDFQNLARTRLADARILLRNNRFDAAYYVLGIAIECGLKACIARKTNRHDFPDKELVNQSYTHELTKLVRAAGLDRALDAALAANALLNANWLTVKDWSIESRYLSAGRAKAVALHSAINQRRYGVMSWIRLYW
jgi:HEPN domain-containing protein